MESLKTSFQRHCVSGDISGSREVLHINTQ